MEFIMNIEAETPKSQHMTCYTSMSTPLYKCQKGLISCEILTKRVPNEYYSIRTSVGRCGLVACHVL